MRNTTWLCPLALAVAGCAQLSGSPVGAGTAAGPPARPVMPSAETTPVESASDAADDAAIWVHPRDPAQSLVIGTDKQKGLHVYDLDGRILQSLPDGRMNNVDLRDGFTVDGRAMTLVAASNRTDRSIALYLLDSATRRLTRVGDPVRTGFADPYGLCLYASPDGAHYVFVSEADSGRFRQWRIRAAAGAIFAERVREFRVGSQAEGCAVDDEMRALYVAEEDRGFWRYRADPDGGSDRHEIDRVGGANGLAADLEGVSIWQGSGGLGYVVLSNQGANSYAVYRRDADNAFIGLFQIVDDAAGRIDGASETDGLAVTSQPLGVRYPDGLLIVQDGSNEPSGQHQNFKLVSWRDVAMALALPDEG